MASSSVASRKVWLWQFVVLLVLASYTFAPGVALDLAPPAGNEVAAAYQGQGVQIYQCAKDSVSGNPTWQHTGALSTLTAKDFYTVTHYFQSHPDALGGKQTFSTSDKEESDADSTVTGLVVTSIPSPDPGSNIDSLLLVATSHSGPGALGRASYIQRLQAQGGVAPAASTCTDGNLNQVQKVPYNASYVFYYQVGEPPAAHTPASLAVPAEYKPLWSWYATGTVTYERQTNSSSWTVSEQDADLSYLPGSLVVGGHFVDSTGAYTWASYLAQLAEVEGTVIASESVTRDLDWLLLKVTAKLGDHSNSTVGYVQRVSTLGGLPPIETGPSTTVAVPYSAVFWFYGWW